MSITLKSFLKGFDDLQNTDDKNNYVVSHVNNVYIPYEQKTQVCLAIADTCFWNLEKDSSGNEVKVFHVDSVAKYMVTCVSVIDLYTDIHRDKKSGGDMLSDFNELNKRGIIDMVIQNIDKREIKEFNMVLEFVCQDVYTNEYENHAFIGKQVVRFADIVGNIISSIMGDVDMDQLKSFLVANGLASE